MVSMETLQKQIKAYFEKTNKVLPKSKNAMNELTGFANYIIMSNQKDIQEFVDNAIQRVLSAQRVPNINEVFVNRITGIKTVVDYKMQMQIQENRNQYFFVCKAPHLDNDFTYNCSNPLCKCNQNEFSIYKN
jgi:preprotein translocase subunit Sss1